MHRYWTWLTHIPSIKTNRIFQIFTQQLTINFLINGLVLDKRLDLKEKMVFKTYLRKLKRPSIIWLKLEEGQAYLIKRA